MPSAILGPKSKCVLIQKKWGRPIVCNDGIPIAKELELENPEANVGAHNDAAMGEMVAHAYEKLGRHYRRRIQNNRIVARSCRGHAVRSRIHLSLLLAERLNGKGISEPLRGYPKLLRWPQPLSPTSSQAKCEPSIPQESTPTFHP